MRITELKLKNFRNYTDLVLHPDPGVNLFYGRNGSGKTNLLEAIHYTALGRSHRILNDASAVRYGEKFALSSVSVSSNLGMREISVRLHPSETQKKEIFTDGKKIQKFSDMMGCLRCVIFSPEDLGLIREGPSIRRRYLDMMISQISRRYFVALQQYKAGLDQRNAVLKKLRNSPSSDNGLLGVFEEVMAAQASEIVKERRRIVSLLSDIASDTYIRISGTEEKLGVSYHSSVREEEGIADILCGLLKDNRENDIRLGVTSVGPHRDDLMITLDGNPMKQFASQGQVRTAALSLKLSQMKILKDDSGEDPVLLLDDVMSELDRKRRASLISEIRSFQTFITCTDRADLECEKISRVWHVTAADGIASLTSDDN